MITHFSTKSDSLRKSLGAPGCAFHEEARPGRMNDPVGARSQNDSRRPPPGISRGAAFSFARKTEGYFTRSSFTAASSGVTRTVRQVW